MLWSRVIELRHDKRVRMFLNSMMAFIKNQKMDGVHFNYAVSQNIQQNLSCHNKHLKLKISKTLASREGFCITYQNSSLEEEELKIKSGMRENGYP